MLSQNAFNKLSRRNWLRDAAIATTGAAVLPSFLTSCADHAIPPGLGEGNPGNGLLTNSELANAAQNLMNMDKWLASVRLNTVRYESIVYATLESGSLPSDYHSFIGKVLLKILELLIEAALAGTPGGAALIPVVAAAFGLATEFIYEWQKNNATAPPSLEASFASIELAMDAIYKATSDKLNTLADPASNYKNLRDAWQREIEFNGKKYVLKDLATSEFPTEGTTIFVTLRTGAIIRYQQSVWNLMFVKAGQMQVGGSFYKKDETSSNYTPAEYARDEFYRDNKADYLRGYYKDGYFYYQSWHFEFGGGKRLTAAAVNMLFKDDTPEHIINPNGLFNRDFVFKQFHSQKPSFSPYHELRKDASLNKEDRNTSWWGFDGEHKTDDFDFTGGM